MRKNNQNTSIHSWLTLASVPAMTTAKWNALLNKYSISACAFLHSDEWMTNPNLPLTSEQLAQIRQLRKSANDKLLDQAYRWLDRDPANQIITRDMPDWPSGFSSLTSPPLLLFARGNTSRLGDPQIAVVGSRMATRAGLSNAALFASQLAAAGITVTSGLASGIDAAAHKAANAIEGRTVAFLGSGPDVIYPRRNIHLAEEIVSHNGLLVSEFSPGTPPKRHHFPGRNRLIAAISAGTLVVEATIKSGTLITANLAADLGREVFAVPGNIANVQTEGCHALIQQGAKLVVTADHILEEFNHLARSPVAAAAEQQQKSEDQNLATDKLLDSVDFDVTGVDIIAERSALPVSAVMAALLEYELRGLVTPVPGGYVKLRGK